MLENCPDLLACETNLVESTRHVEYLGEVDFLFSDIEKLSTLVKDAVAGVENGAEFLGKLPACLSFYLVGKGITGYDSGDYWTRVSQELGVPVGVGPNKLGAVFLGFLRDKKLFHSRIKGAMPFVSRILLHGGIPRSCRKQFHAGVVRYLLERELVEEDDIRREIAGLREEEKKRAELSRVRDELRLRCQSLQWDVESLDNLIRLNRRRKELVDQTMDRDVWSPLPDYDSFLASARASRLGIDETMEDLHRHKDQCLAVIRCFTAEDRTLVDLGPVIDDLVANFEQYRHALRQIPAAILETEEYQRRLYGSINPPVTLGGDESAGDLLWTLEREFLATALGAPKAGGVHPAGPAIGELIVLVKEQPQLDGLVAAAERWAGRLLALRDAGRNRQRLEASLSAIKPSIANWEVALKSLTDSLALPPAGSPEEVLDELAEMAVQAIDRKINAFQARDAVAREIAPALADARASRKRITREIAVAGQFVRDLGDGDFDAGIRLLGDKHAALLKLKEIEEGLKRFEVAGFPFGLDEGRAWAERLAQELQNIGRYLDLKEEQIELLAFVAKTRFWAGLPDYDGFLAERQAELAAVGRELQKL